MSAGDQLERECTRFLYREAELLDRRRLHEWLQLLTPDIDYRVPVRTTRAKKDGDGFSTKSFFLDEDYGSLKLRVARFDSDFAWAENPPSRTRRMVSNIRIGGSGSGADQDPKAQSQAVTSNLALYCFRGESAEPTVLTGERQDVLRRVNGEWKLRSRLVLLDTTIMGMESMSIFL